jgi:phosphorylase/glycogen(starch) synthase
MGMDLIKQVIEISKDKRFIGKILFIEDYDLYTARHLLQGVDVWLNTPRRPYEACGTSGQKVIINGGLNMSVSDGWWPEGFDGTNGWTVGPVTENYSGFDDSSIADERDAQSLYSLLEDKVIPMFYDRDTNGIPKQWTKMVKESMAKLIPKFNANRMVQQYLEEMYIPSARRKAALVENGFNLAKEVSDWKNKTPVSFSPLKLIDVLFERIYGDTLQVGEPFTVNVRIDPGSLEPDEILVELVIGRIDGHDFIRDPESVPLELESRSEKMLTFSCICQVAQSGQYSYGIRILPYNKNLSIKQELGLALWG